MPQLVKSAIVNTPQARVLKVLAPKDTTDHWTDWPEMTRYDLSVRIGWNPTTGTLNRALHGIRKGSSCGAAHLGLLDLELVKEVTIELDSRQTTVYRITAAGVKALQRYLTETPRLPKKRDKELCVNARYQTA